VLFVENNCFAANLYDLCRALPGYSWKVACLGRAYGYVKGVARKQTWPVAQKLGRTPHKNFALNFAGRRPRKQPKKQGLFPGGGIRCRKRSCAKKLGQLRKNFAGRRPRKQPEKQGLFPEAA